MKTCSKCNTEKPLVEFCIAKRIKSGYTSYCRACSSIMSLQWRNKRADHCKEVKKKYYEQDKEKLKEKAFLWKLENKHKVKESNDKSAKRNREALTEVYLNAMIKKRGINPDSVDPEIKELFKESVILKRKIYEQNKKQ